MGGPGLVHGGDSESPQALDDGRPSPQPPQEIPQVMTAEGPVGCESNTLSEPDKYTLMN